MRKIRILTCLVILIMVAPLLFSHYIRPAAAAPVFTVDLDANSISQTDTAVQSSFTTTKSIRVGAIINATGTDTIPNIFGWQIQINYDPTVFVLQGDPAVSSTYPDGADNTMKLGAQITAGTVNWAAKVASNQAFASFTNPLPGSILVFFTLQTASPVTLSARTLLANINFELLSKPASPTSLTVSSILFVDPSGAPLPQTIIPGILNLNTSTLSTDPKIKFIDANTNNGVWDPGEIVGYDANNNGRLDTGEFQISSTAFLPLNPVLVSDPKLKFVDTNLNGHWDPGEAVAYDSNADNTFNAGDIAIAAGAVVTITNDPPHASFTTTKNSAYVFSFNSTSTDSDGTIANPAGYYWDFGDGTFDRATTGPSISNHDYSTNCTPTCPNGASLGAYFTVTLRVVDNGGATGSARASDGTEIINNQPSHTSQTIAVSVGPVAGFTHAPTVPSLGDAVTFDASSSTDDASITSYSWSFGDGSPNATSVTTTHAYAAGGLYTVKLAVVDNLGNVSSTTQTIIVATPLSLQITGPTAAETGTTVTLNLSASSATPGGSVATLKVDWGDGKIDTLSGTSTTATHTYSTAGNYNVTVTATDNYGKSTVKTQTLAITAPAPQQPAFPIWALIAIPIVAIAAAGILLLRRRRKPATQQSQ